MHHLPAKLRDFQRLLSPPESTGFALEALGAFFLATPVKRKTDKRGNIFRL
jgi:hypothetical protein